MTTQKRELRVALEWRSYPLWWSHDDGGAENPDPRTFVVGALGEELHRWAEEYDGYWDPDDPRGPTFPDREAELAFFARGRSLAQRLADAVGDRWAVRFEDADGDWVQLS